MKITNARVIVTSPGRNFVTLKIETDQGLYGLGDATLNGRELAVASYLSDHVIPTLIGRDAQRIEDIWQYLYKGAYWRRGPVTMSAISAVDTALWDLKAKQAGLPLYQLLGGACREGVMVYGHANGETIAETLAEAKGYLERGYLAVRLQTGVPGLKSTYGVSKDKLFYEPADAANPTEHIWSTERYLRSAPDLFAAARETLGWEVHLLHDAHHRLNPIEAARLGARSYMLGLGLSQPLLQRAADQAYAGGVFCLALTGFGGSPLTTNTLAALFPELSELFPDVPLTLAFHPQNPPIVTIGAGTVQNNQPQDPLINLVLPGVRIDALASLDGRQVRAFAFTSDLTLPLAIIAGTGGTSVQIVLGSASNFLGNIQGEASDLLNLPAATVTVQLQKFLPLALGLAGNSLGSLPAIALPSIEGFSPSITAIGGIVPSGTGEFLDVGVFLNLGQAASAATPPGFSARLVGSSFPSANDVGPGGTLSALPAEILALEGGTAALEASYRIDDGPPSAWLRGSPLVIADPLLLLVGPHHLSVRVRPQGDLGSGDLTTLQVVSAFAAAPTATTVASVLAGPPSEPSSAVAIDASRSSCATGLGLGAWGLLALSFAGFLRRRR